jgi:hypothetical protein
MNEEERRRRQKARQKRDQRRESSRLVRVKWPSQEAIVGRDPEDLTDAETRGIVLCPLVTGIAAHPRSVSDEDWVQAAIEHAEEFGEPEMLADLLYLLRQVTPYLLGEASTEVQDYPPSKSDRKLPLPNVAARVSDQGYDKHKWTPEMVGAVLCNPVFAGVPPFAPLIEEKRWLNAAVNRREYSLEQLLVNILFSLRVTFGSPGSPQKVIPMGYK